MENPTKVLIVTDEQFEDSELFDPKRALEARGVKVDIATPEKGHRFRGKHGKAVIADLTLREVDADDYALLLIPGGKAPEKLRHDDHALDVARAFMKANKPVAAICHGPAVLVNARVVEGRRMTSHPDVARDLRDYGALWEDKPVVVDGNLTTSRNPGDLPAFIAAILNALGLA